MLWRRANAPYSSFSTIRRERFDVNPALTASGAGGWLADEVQRTRGAFVRGELGGGSFRLPDRTLTCGLGGGGFGGARSVGLEPPTFRSVDHCAVSSECA